MPKYTVYISPGYYAVFIYFLSSSLESLPENQYP